LLSGFADGETMVESASGFF